MTLTTKHNDYYRLRLFAAAVYKEIFNFSYINISFCFKTLLVFMCGVVCVCKQKDKENLSKNKLSKFFFSKIKTFQNLKIFNVEKFTI